MQLIRIQTTEEYFYFPHLVVLGRYCACEILIANPIDWLYAACPEYFIFFSIDSSETRKQYDKHCLSIMQTITYATILLHFRSSIDRPLNLPQYPVSNNYFSISEENI
jgi:hypothetical protein